MSRTPSEGRPYSRIDTGGSDSLRRTVLERESRETTSTGYTGSSFTPSSGIGVFPRTAYAPYGRHNVDRETFIGASEGPTDKRDIDRIRQDIERRRKFASQTTESLKSGSMRSGTTYTEEKPILIAPPVLANQIKLTNQRELLNKGEAKADVHATTKFDIKESDLRNVELDEFENYRKKVEALAKQQEQATHDKAAAYKDQIERDAEAIRTILENQHNRDVQFRRGLIEDGIERHQKEIQLETEYALRVLEKERDAAREALEKAGAMINIDVSIESAIGVTHSTATVNSTFEKKTVSEARGA